jgi:hypothetical protein
MLFNKEMQRALQADGEKLRQLTGEDHGPHFWTTCPECQGEGAVGTGIMSHAVNTATIDPPWELGKQCPTCGGCGYVESSEVTGD